MARSGSLSEDVRTVSGERFDALAFGVDTRVERIVSTGDTTPPGEWYNSPHAEFVVLIEGGARLQFENETGERELGPGDWLLIDAHERHRVTWTRADPPTIWLAVHYAG